MSLVGGKNVDITWAFNRDLLDKEVTKAAMKGLRQISEVILGESGKEVPVDTGILKDSGTVQKKGTEIIISYNTPYARYQHENHRAKAKYLERPFNANKDKAPYYVEQSIANAVYKKKVKAIEDSYPS